MDHRVNPLIQQRSLIDGDLNQAMVQPILSVPPTRPKAPPLPPLGGYRKFPDSDSPLPGRVPPPEIFLRIFHKLAGAGKLQLGETRSRGNSLRGKPPKSEKVRPNCCGQRALRARRGASQRQARGSRTGQWPWEAPRTPVEPVAIKLTYLLLFWSFLSSLKAGGFPSEWARLGPRKDRSHL